MSYASTLKASAASEPRLHRGISRLPMIILGVGGAIGTGALFSGVAMAAVAGPAMIISWVVGCIIYAFIGITYVDMSARFPEAGGPARYALYTHGPLANLVNSVASVVWYLFIPPVEAIATVEGISHFDSALLTAKGDPTTAGALVALGLLIIYVPFNYYGIRFFSRITNVLGGAKIVLYLLLALGFIVVLSDGHNYSSYGGFAPFGASAIFAAVPTAMFAFGGIRVIPDFAEEATDTRALKLGILATLAIQFAIYIIFSIAFIGGISWGTLAVKTGAWSALTKVAGNPFILLSSGRNVGWLLAVAVIVGIIGPGVVGYVYQGAGARVLMSMARTGYVSSRLSAVDRRHEIPANALLVIAVIGAILALLTAPVPRIYSLINDAVVGGYVSFGVVPAAMIALRRQKGERPSIGATLIAVLGFAGASEIVYWSGWPAVPYAAILLTIGVILIALLARVRGLRNALWYIVWIMFLVAMAGIGSVGEGTLVSFNAGSIITAAVSIFIVFPWAVHSRLPELAGVDATDQGAVAQPTAQ
jgi:amino acid transporter